MLTHSFSLHYSVLAQNHSESHLRRVLSAQVRFPVEVVIAHPADTQAVEQGWSVLTQFRHTLIHLQPRVFEYVLLRLLHELNKEMWGGVPDVCAQALPRAEQPRGGTDSVYWIERYPYVACADCGHRRLRLPRDVPKWAKKHSSARLARV